MADSNANDSPSHRYQLLDLVEDLDRALAALKKLPNTEDGADTAAISFEDVFQIEQALDEAAAFLDRLWYEDARS